MKENRNAGFTLIEIMIAMAMSLIIITAVGQFMSVSSTTYQAVDKQVNMQVEAQSVINAISDMVLEANNVAYKEDTKNKYFFIYYDLGTTYSNGTEIKLVNHRTAKQKIIWFEKPASGKAGKLYLFDCKDHSGNIYDKATGTHDGAQLFAEGVKDVSFSLATATTSSSTLTADGLTSAVASQSSPSVRIDVELWSKVTAQSTKEDGYTYKASNVVAPRNEIVDIP